MKTRANPVYCGIDTTDLPWATRLIQSIAGGPRPAVGGIKLGLEFFLAHGAPGVRYAFPAPVRATGVGFFLDLKLHDIPNTVAGGIRAVAELAPTFITLHASGGRDMLRAAVDEAATQAAKHGVPRARLLGVTVLTSLDRSDLEATGVNADPSDQVAASGHAGPRKRARRRDLLAAGDRRPAARVRPRLRADGARHPAGRQRRQRPEAGDDAAPGGRSRGDEPGGRPADLPGSRSRARRPKRSPARPASTTYERAMAVEAKICGLSTPETVDAAVRRRRPLRRLRDLSAVAPPRRLQRHAEGAGCARASGRHPRRPVRRSRRCAARRAAGDRRASTCCSCMAPRRPSGWRPSAPGPASR